MKIIKQQMDEMEELELTIQKGQETEAQMK
jgi:hypothetical protein